MSCVLLLLLLPGEEQDGADQCRWAEGDRIGRTGGLDAPYVISS